MANKQIYPVYAGIHQWHFSILKASLSLHINPVFPSNGSPFPTKYMILSLSKTKHSLTLNPHFRPHIYPHEIFCRNGKGLTLPCVCSPESKGETIISNKGYNVDSEMSDSMICPLWSVPWPPGRGGPNLTRKPLACSFPFLKQLPHSISFLFYIMPL